MTKEQMAETLDGREYMNEITADEIKLARQGGLTVVHGSSDDLVEFAGAIDEETDGPGEHLLSSKGWLLPSHEKYNCDCGFCDYEATAKNALVIKSKYGAPDGWTFETDIPHATFRILEDGQPYCTGIVFSVSDIEAAK